MSSASGAVRSLYDRMTKPTPEDLQGVASISSYTRDQVKMIVDRVLLEALRKLAENRDDFDVHVTTDDRGWSVRIDLT
jgi:hypothetical protein